MNNEEIKKDLVNGDGFFVRDHYKDHFENDYDYFMFCISNILNADVHEYIDKDITKKASKLSPKNKNSKGLDSRKDIIIDGYNDGNILKFHIDYVAYYNKNGKPREITVVSIRMALDGVESVVSLEEPKLSKRLDVYINPIYKAFIDNKISNDKNLKKIEKFVKDKTPYMVSDSVIVFRPSEINLKSYKKYIDDLKECLHKSSYVSDIMRWEGGYRPLENGKKVKCNVISDNRDSLEVSQHLALVEIKKFDEISGDVELDAIFTDRSSFSNYDYVGVFDENDDLLSAKWYGLENKTNEALV